MALGAPLLRLRSDEQLVALFRAGHDEAFRAIHDRYHKRLFAYARQMLPARQDAEDALQDVFVRAYAGLRVSDRNLALRAWLFRVAHNRCVDELRKPAPPPPEVLHLVGTGSHDPLTQVELRESLRRLVEDIRRLPDQQRSVLLMRELAGMSYGELASSLGVSVGAVKSLLVRARLGLAQAAAARDTACGLVREQLVEAYDRGVRPNANTRKHMRDCSGCKSFRRELRGVSRQLAATAPAVGPLGFLANLLGLSGGGGAAGGAGGGAALLGGGGTTASVGGLALSTGHVATLLVAAVATAGGALEIQHAILPVAKPAVNARPHTGIRHRTPPLLATQATATGGQTSVPPATSGFPPRTAFGGASSAGRTAAKSPSTDAAADRTTATVRGTVGGAVKRRASSGSSTATGTRTATTGASTSSACSAPGAVPPTSGASATGSSAYPAGTSAPPAGTSVPAAGTSAAAGSSAPATNGSASSASSAGATTTGSAASGSASSPGSQAASTSCDSSAGSSVGSSAPSASSSTAGSSAAPASVSSAPAGSGSPAAASSGSSPGASQAGSSAATG